MSRTKIRKAERKLSDLDDAEKFSLLREYCSGDKNNVELAAQFGISNEAVDTFIKKIYKKLQNVREIRMLIGTSYNPTFSEIMRKKHVDSEHINESFLSLLSGPEEPLTENEILFCEFLIEYGEDDKAIAKSKLDISLKKSEQASYREGCKLRAFYLKKKPNIAAYITKARQENLGVLENYGKEYIQSRLIEIVEQLGNIGDKGSLTHQLKALESLAKTVGAFEERVVVETVNGDDALDRLISRAKEAHAKKQEPQPIAYVDGQEIYE
jgi:DNA-binding CsgD family transcriptional regulator